MAANVTCTKKPLTLHAGTGSYKQICIGLFTQSKWDASCKEGFVGLDLKSLTWILAMLKTDSKRHLHR